MEEAVELAKEVSAQERPYEIKRLMNAFYEDRISLGYLINLFVLEFGRE